MEPQNRRTIRGVEMWPQKQTILGTENGNCYPACLATLLCIPIAEVPNFYSEENRGRYTPEESNNNIRRWLNGHGLDCLRLVHTPNLMDWFRGTRTPIVATIKSPRHEGFNHAVVYVGHHFAFDPHPDAKAEEGREIIEIEVFLALKMAGPQKRR